MPVARPISTLYLVAVATVLLGAATLHAQEAQPPGPLLDFHGETDFVPQTPGVTAGAPAGWINPAAWATPVRGEGAFWWNDRNLRQGSLDNWGLALVRKFGFSVNSQIYPASGNETQRITDYQLGYASGGRSGTWGIAYRWSGGGPREPSLALGFLRRPARQVSFGISGQTSISSSARQLGLDLGLRPLGTEVVTLFGQYTLGTLDNLDDGRWGTGLLIRPVPGLHLGAKALDVAGTNDYRWLFEAGVTLGGLGIHVLPSMSEGGDLGQTTYLLRTGSPSRSLPFTETFWPPRGRHPRFAAFDLEAKVLTYQKYQWFDDKNVPWIDLARVLQAVRSDPQIDGVAFNLRGLATSRALAWELAQEMRALREAGKEVVVAIDRVGMTGYALAAHADRVFMDSEGMLSLPGVAMRRTYLKNLMEKLGLGVQELRFFTHKSAAESISRDSMSEADREQRQRIVDVFYATARDAAVAGRSVDGGTFDRIVDDEVLVTSARAAELGLVDGVGNWKDLQAWVVKERGGGFTSLGRNHRPGLFPEENWGEPLRIALVYARGICAMDTGIRGRATSNYLRRLLNDPLTRAVVLRVDSPGGDGMASEAIAAAVRDLNAAGKPVIVSQGNVAASGGYWLSMDGAEVLTTPVTITGSIGVIGAWVYDDGFGEKTGLTTDGVQAGEHADLFTDVRMPLLGFGPSQRALTDEEFELSRRLIMSLYDDFVTRVAQGRDLSETRVRELGEGRVWMGGDAIERGLCDRFGTMADAVATARRRAGIPDNREIRLVEYPPRPLFPWPRLGPELPGMFKVFAPVAKFMAGLTASEAVASAELLEREAELMDYARMLAGSQGRPLAVIPPDYLTVRDGN